MEAVMESIRLNVPKSDMAFFKKLVNKMGWELENKESFLSQYIASRPKNVELSDDEIMSEVYAVRYGQ